MPHALPALSPTVLWGIALVVVGVVFLAIPRLRRMIHACYMQISGFFDALILGKRPAKLVIDVVSRRMNLTTRRIEAEFQSALTRWHKRAWWRVNLFIWALKAFEDASAALERATLRSAMQVTTAPAAQETSHFPWSVYLVSQVLIAIGDTVFTYLAFELWYLPPAALVPVVLLIGAMGAYLGHFSGQMIQAQKNRYAIAFILIGSLYCVALGGMRFAYLLATHKQSVSPLIDGLGAWGWPVVFMAASIVLATQARHSTLLEIARRRHSSAERNYKKAFQSGKRAAERLEARMNQRRAYALALIDAYRRGFAFGWKTEPLDFPEQSIVLPDEIHALWPPYTPAPQMLRPADSQDTDQRFAPMTPEHINT